MRVRARRTILGLWLACVAASAWLIAASLELESDVSLFMPAPSSAAERLVHDTLREGTAARVLMLAISAPETQRAAELSRALAARLRDSALFARVENGEFQGRPTGFEAQPMFRYRYLLSDLDANAFSSTALRGALEQRLTELGSPLAGFYKRTLASDPSATLRALAARFAAGRELGKRHGVWFADSGRQALLLVETASGGFDTDAAERALGLITATFQSLDRDAGTKLEISGPGVFALAAREATEREARRLSIIAAILLSVLVLAVYRSPRAWLMSVVPVASGMLAGTAALVLGFGVVHGIALAFGATLLGIAIDYPLHLFSHANAHVSFEESSQAIWPTLRLGAATSVVGFLALCTTSFTGLAQLGVFAACGLLAAAAVSRWVLPALLGCDWRPAYDFSRRRYRSPRGVAQGGMLALVVVASVASAGVIIGSRETLWQRDLAALSPLPESTRALDRRLRASLKAPDPRHLIVVDGADAEDALARSEQLIAGLESLIDAGALEGYDMAARYLPSKARQRERQTRLPTPEALGRALDVALQGLAFRRGVFAPFVDAVAESKTLSPLAPEDVAGSAAFARVGALLQSSPAGARALLTLANVRNAAAIEQWLAEQAGGELTLVDLKHVSNEAVTRFTDEALARLGLAALTVVVVLTLALRSARRVIAITLALASAALIDVAVLVLLGEKLSLFHLMALPVVFGIGIDYGLFFSWSAPSPQARQRTVHALIVCAASTSGVFGVLAYSELPVLRAIGLTVAIGVLATFCCALVFARAFAEAR